MNGAQKPEGRSPRLLAQFGSKARGMGNGLNTLRHLDPKTEMSRIQAILVRHIQVFFMVARWKIYDRLKLHAQALTYNSLLGLVPFFAVAFAIIEGLGGFDELSVQLRETLVSNLTGAPEVKETISAYIDQFTNNIRQGKLGAIPVVLLTFSVLSLLGHIENSFNAIYGVHTGRPLAIRMLTYWSIITAAPLLMLGSLALSTALQTSAFVNSVESLGVFRAFLIRVTPFVVSWIAFTLLFYVVPNQRVRWAAAVWAAFITACLWSAARYGYTIYAKNAFTLQNIYGSLATIPLFILWLYVSWILLLFGAQLTYAFQHARTHWIDDLGLRASEAYKEQVACRLLAEVAFRFYEGHPPPTLDNIAETTQAPRPLIAKMTAALIDGGYIRAAGSDDALVPARNLENVTVDDVLHHLRHEVGASPGIREDCVTARIRTRIHEQCHSPDTARRLSFRSLAHELSKEQGEVKIELPSSSASKSASPGYTSR